MTTYAYSSSSCAHLVNETNPLTDAMRSERMEITRDGIPWDTAGLTIERLRLVSDPGFPNWDVSYCYGRLGGELVGVALPFDRLPKRGMRQALYRAAQKTGRFIPGLFQAISTLN